jgi:endonuclease-3 related protein
MVGAVLTQNTSWRNVEKAIDNLQKRRLLSPGKILKARDLARYIRSSGFHSLKAERLKELCRYLTRGGVFDPEYLKSKSTGKLRTELLDIKGIGPETADSILLYALDKPVFVVDNYTKRIMSRYGIISFDEPYEQIREKVSANFPRSTAKLKQFHAVIVETGKIFCKKTKPLCGECPLKCFCGQIIGTN